MDPKPNTSAPPSVPSAPVPAVPPGSRQGEASPDGKQRWNGHAWEPIVPIPETPASLPAPNGPAVPVPVSTVEPAAVNATPETTRTRPAR